MPNIVEFANQENLRPDESAASLASHAAQTKNVFAREAGSAIGRGISSIGPPLQNMADRAEDHIASQFIGHGAATSAQLWATLTDDINNTMGRADPNDTSVGHGLKEKSIEPALENFYKQFEGAPKKAQDWALSTVDRMRDHFYRTISAEEMIRASSAVEQNIKSTYLGLSASAAGNPAGLPDVVAQLRLNADALIASHGIPAAERARLDAEVQKMNGRLAEAAADTMIRSNPSAFKKEVIEGKFNAYWDVPKQTEMMKKADSALHDKRVNDEYEFTLQKRAQQEAGTAAKNDYVTSALNGKKMGDYANDPRLEKFPEIKENLRSLAHTLTMQAIDRSENTPHPQQWRNLIDQLHKTSINDPNNISDRPIYDALRKGQLNKSEFASALSIFHSIESPIEKTIRAQVNRVEAFSAQSIEGRTLKMTDSAGYVDAINRFELEGRQKINAAKAKGEDVTPLVDPTSKQFVFSPQRFASMLPSANESIKSNAEAARIANKSQAPASAVEYLKTHPEAKDDFKAKYGYLPDESRTATVKTVPSNSQFEGNYELESRYPDLKRLGNKVRAVTTMTGNKAAAEQARAILEYNDRMKELK